MDDTDYNLAKMKMGLKTPSEMTEEAHEDANKEDVSPGVLSLLKNYLANGVNKLGQNLDNQNKMIKNQALFAAKKATNVNYQPTSEELDNQNKYDNAVTSGVAGGLNVAGSPGGALIKAKALAKLKGLGGKLLSKEAPSLEQKASSEGIKDLGELINPDIAKFQKTGVASPELGERVGKLQNEINDLGIVNQYDANKANELRNSVSQINNNPIPVNSEESTKILNPEVFKKIKKAMGS